MFFDGSMAWTKAVDTGDQASAVATLACTSSSLSHCRDVCKGGEGKTLDILSVLALLLASFAEKRPVSTAIGGQVAGGDVDMAAAAVVGLRMQFVA